MVASVAFFVVFLAFGALSIAGVFFWVMKLLEVVRIPEDQYRAAGTEKTTWVVVVAVAQAIGALVWHFAKRREVLDAAGRAPGLAPGWYPQPGTALVRWWDGVRWTEHTHS